MKFFSPLLFIFIVYSGFAGTSDSLSTRLDSYIEANYPAMPYAEVLIGQNIQDVFVTNGPSSTYYLTGTTGDFDGVQEGIKVWASTDFKNWNLISTHTDYIWTFEEDAVDWQKAILEVDGHKRRGITAPEIHYIKGTYYLTYTNSNSGNAGILRSLSGRPQGPYEEISGDEPLIRADNVTLFEDDNGTVYFIWGNGLVHRMLPDMSGFASVKPRILTNAAGEKLNVSGINVQLIDGEYYLSGSKRVMQNADKNCFAGNRYDAVVYKSSNIWGPYYKLLDELPHGGGGHLVETFNDSLCYIFSNETASCAFGPYPGVVPLSKSPGKLAINSSENEQRPVVYVSRIGNNSNGSSWDNAYTNIQRAIDNAPEGAQIWVATGYYYKPVVINLLNKLSIYGGFAGWEKSLSERDSDMNRVILNGRQQTNNLLIINASKHVRIDGITIKGGNANGQTEFGQYGAGVHVLGGGETVKFVNCRFEENKASQDGGAVYASLGASPVFVNCWFTGNIADNNGGAVAVYGNSPNGYTARFYNCTFRDNRSQVDGGALYFHSNFRGHGLLKLVNCLLDKNQCFSSGGAVKADGYANVMIQNSTFCYNIGIQSGASVVSSAAIPGRMTLLNSIFYKNNGGTLFQIEGEADTLVFNERIHYRNIWVKVHHCLFSQNETKSIVERRFDRKSFSEIDALNTSVIGRACLSDIPEFVDSAQGDYRLRSNSPARNSGTSTCLFRYDKNMQKRLKGRVNLGCY